jgi:hypothetical protein
MAQTAVSALMESIFGSDFRLTVSDDILNKYQISVEMEKQQMSNFANEYADAVMGGCIKRAEQYYNETFKK